MNNEINNSISSIKEYIVQKTDKTKNEIDENISNIKNYIQKK